MPLVALSYLDDPADSVVWRYMNFEKILSILIDQALFFPSRAVLAFSDRYEGQAMASELAGYDRAALKEVDDKHINPTIDSFFFNCWHMNDGESDAMWKIYVDGTRGVGVRSTVARLKQCFEHSSPDLHLARIRYVD